MLEKNKRKDGKREVKVRKKVDEIKTAEKILKIIYRELGKGQFNFHVAKAKEDMVETKLEALDTKRILEAVTALEKIVNMKKKSAEDRPPEEELKGKIILPEVEYPEDAGGEEL